MVERPLQNLVLIVDDDPDFLEAHSLMLERAGFRVVTADCRAAAEALIAEIEPDFAVIDLMMEEKDSGFILAHHLRRRHPDVPIIMVSSVTSETGLEFDDGTGEGNSWVKADMIMSKPVRFEDLKRNIDILMSANPRGGMKV